MKPSRIAELTPFLWVAAFWFVLSLAVIGFFSPPETVRAAAGWMTGLWALCLLDLIALARAVAAVLEYLGAEGEKRIPLVIQASYWAFLKIICLGIFTVILIRGRTIPSAGLLLGLGTLVIVPLVGGFWWSHRSVRPEDDGNE